MNNTVDDNTLIVIKLRYIFILQNLYKMSRLYYKKEDHLVLRNVEIIPNFFHIVLWCHKTPVYVVERTCSTLAHDFALVNNLKYI